jgi:nucleotidyltransferase/DNA polymerase involved in DNA repair
VSCLSRNWSSSPGRSVIRPTGGTRGDQANEAIPAAQRGGQGCSRLADSLDPTFVLGRARALAGEVFGRFAADGFCTFQTVTITVRFTGFITLSRSRTGKDAWRSADDLEAEVTRLLEPFFDARENPKGKKIRLIGVRVETLSRDASTPSPSRP